MDFLLKLFSADFMPHIYCLRRPEVIWLFIISNAGIALAYFAIPPTLVFFIRKRRDIAFSWMFLLFGLFILACGTTHILDIITLWHPIYRFDVVIRTLTAVASIATAGLLMKIMPKALLLPNPEQLRAEINKRAEIQQQLEKLNRELEDRVLERTATLHASNNDLQTAVQELRYQLQLNHAITSQAGDAILATDARGHITFANPQTQRTFGYTASELFGRNVHQTLHLDPHAGVGEQQLHCALTNAIGSGSALHDWSTEFYHKSGLPIPVACSAGPVELDGERSGAVIVVRDVTDRVKAEKALQESELKYRSLVEAMPQLVWSASLDGRVDYLSKQWEAFTGISAQEHLGTAWPMAVHPDDLERTKEGWKISVLSLADYEVEHRLRRHDGSWLWFKSRAVALIDGDEPIRWMGTSTDIDSDKRATESLSQFNADLQNLASALAHDLHEPLRAIATQSQVLARYVEDDLNDKGSQIVQGIVDNAIHMRRLLQDITIYSETITHPLDIHSVDLKGLVQTVVARRRQAMVDTDITVDIGDDVQVEADDALLRLVFRQLLDNSIAYRKPDGLLSVQISTQVYESELVVAFSDNGVGIKPEYHERVFGLFKRLHKQHDHPGSGIGLAMCQKILQRHGKRIWVRSNSEGGVTFFFSLQLALPVLQPRS